MYLSCVWLFSIKRKNFPILLFILNREYGIPDCRGRTTTTKTKGRFSIDTLSAGRIGKMMFMDNGHHQLVLAGTIFEIPVGSKLSIFIASHMPSESAFGAFLMTGGQWGSALHISALMVI